VWFHYRKVHWYFAALIISLLTLVWFANKPEATLTEKIAGLIGVLFLWAIVLVAFAVFWTLVTRFSGGRFRGSVGPHTFEIGEDAFVESNVQGRQEVRLAGLRRVGESDAHFFVLTNTGTGYVIPKRDLQNFEALHDLQRKVAGRVA